MIDHKTATSLAEEFRLADGWHPFLLALQVIANGEGECWEPPSKAALKRSLRRPKDDAVLSDKDLDAVIRHAVSMGLLTPGSAPDRLVLDAGQGERQ